MGGKEDGNKGEKRRETKSETWKHTTNRFNISGKNQSLFNLINNCTLF